MKKSLVILFLCLFLISFVSTWDDSSKDAPRAREPAEAGDTAVLSEELSAGFFSGFWKKIINGQATDSCGDGICEAGETAENCQEDCGAVVVNNKRLSIEASKISLDNNQAALIVKSIKEKGLNLETDLSFSSLWQLELWDYRNNQPVQFPDIKTLIANNGYFPY